MGEISKMGWLMGFVEHAQQTPLAETDPVSETLCFLVCGNPDDGQSPET
jgi:hypothetical protein